MIEEWHPGSFTKNFSWGSSRGLKELHEVIRIGFDNALTDTPRWLFRERVAKIERPDYIPLNFFLYNAIRHGVDFVIADELVFQALNFRHSATFDKLALYAFILSIAGTWKGAKQYQGKPALWAKHYVQDRVSSDFDWLVKQVDANDIERYVSNDNRYRAATARKLATNLSYLYKIGRLSEFKTKRVERWWICALFLTLDRASAEIIRLGQIPDRRRYQEYLIKYGFHDISGPRSTEKDLASIHFIELYDVCGGSARFSEDAVRERQRIMLPDIQGFANNPDPIGVFHPTNPSAVGALPRACAMLARYLSGFEIVDFDELDDFDVENFVKSKVRDALTDLKSQGIKATMSADELLRITRGE